MRILVDCAEFPRAKTTGLDDNYFNDPSSEPECYKQLKVHTHKLASVAKMSSGEENYMQSVSDEQRKKPATHPFQVLHYSG